MKLMEDIRDGIGKNIPFPEELPLHKGEDTLKNLAICLEDIVR